MKRWLILFTFFLYLAPASAFAFTDNSTYPTISPYTLSVTMDSSDVAACLAQDPASDAFSVNADFAATITVTLASYPLVPQTITYVVSDPSLYDSVGIFCGAGGDSNGGNQIGVVHYWATPTNFYHFSVASSSPNCVIPGYGGIDRSKPSNGEGAVFVLNLLAWLQSLGLAMVVMGCIYAFVVAMRMMFSIAY